MAFVILSDKGCQHFIPGGDNFGEIVVPCSGEKPIAHGQNSDHRIIRRLGQGEDITVFEIGCYGDLFFDGPFQGIDLISQPGRPFVFLIPGGGFHLFFYFAHKIRCAALQKHDGLGNLLLINSRVDIEAARRQAALHLAMEAGTRSGFKILGFAFAQFERFVEGAQGFTNGISRSKRSEIFSAVHTYFPDNRKVWIFFVEINSQ